MDAVYSDPASTKEAYSNGLAASFNDPETFPDLAVICPAGGWVRVHKVIVCNMSEWFKKACVSKFKEGNSNSINLQDEESLVREILWYCYTLDYDAPTDVLMDMDSGKRFSDLKFHVKMFAIAEFYQVRGLAKFACDKFKQQAGWALYDEETTQLIEAIDIAYASTTDQRKILRNAIASVILPYRQQLLTGQNEAFKKLLNEQHDFAVDMTFAMALETEVHQTDEASQYNTGYY